MSLHRLEHRRAQRDGLHLGPTHGASHVFVKHRQVIRRRTVRAEKSYPRARRWRAKFIGNRVLFCQLLFPLNLDSYLSHLVLNGSACLILSPVEEHKCS